MSKVTRQKKVKMKIELSEKSIDLLYKALEEMQPNPSDLLGTPVLTIGEMGVYMQCRDLIALIKDQDPRWQRIQ